MSTQHPPDSNLCYNLLPVQCKEITHQLKRSNYFLISTPGIIPAGTIDSPADGDTSGNCLWLMQTQEDAQISIKCEKINLPSCLVRTVFIFRMGVLFPIVLPVILLNARFVAHILHALVAKRKTFLAHL